MAHDIRIVISCPDRPGVLAAITGRLYDIGGNLADATFAVLGEEGEFTAICELPDAVSADEARVQLEATPELTGARITVSPFELAAERSASARVTHRVEVRGIDRPGLVARLTEAFAEFEANIVRMDTERAAGGEDGQYLIRFEVWIPQAREQACLATVANTAATLGLACETRRN
ncbi:MAG: ACT domain-containing protein [Alphaproteobacteria bacterium]